jgi:hypothetical protein
MLKLLHRFVVWRPLSHNPQSGAAPLLRRLVAGFPPRRPGFKTGSGHVGFCDGQKWRWGRFSLRTSVSTANLHSICFSTIIFTITRGWHNRPGVAAVPIASQTRIKKNTVRLSFLSPLCMLHARLYHSLEFHYPNNEGKKVKLSPCLTN